MSLNQRILAWSFCLACLVGLAAADRVWLAPVVWQGRSWRYASAEGRVQSAEVVRVGETEEDGVQYRLELTYQFSAAGRAWTGHRVRYGMEEETDECCPNARQTLAGRYPAGVLVPVYYNPRDPADCLLIRGWQGRDLLVLGWFVPLHVLAGWFLAFLVAQTTRGAAACVAGGVRILRAGGMVRARLTMDPLTAGLQAFLVATLAGTAILAGSNSGNPSMTAMEIAWLGFVFAGVVVGVCHREDVRAGKYDLVVDPAAGTLVLPVTQGRLRRVRVPLAEVTALRVERVEIKDSEGGPSTYQYAPTLFHRDGPAAGECLAKWTSERRARSFVAWLREYLPPPGQVKRSAEVPSTTAAGAQASAAA